MTPITHHFISTWTLTGYQTPDFLMQANPTPARLQLILPGETAVPGNVAAGGKRKNRQHHTGHCGRKLYRPRARYG